MPSHNSVPTSPRNQKIACQSRCTNSQPPIKGAIAGATPKKIVTCDITRCASAGGNMSRMIARATTVPAPADKPCSARNATSQPIDGASAQPADASVKTTIPASTTGRRPKLSASAPWNRFIAAKPSR